MNRHGDEAYLVGRIGVVHAEMGQMDEAIQFGFDHLHLSEAEFIQVV